MAASQAIPLLLNPSNPSSLRRLFPPAGRRQQIYFLQRAADQRLFPRCKLVSTSLKLLDICGLSVSEIWSSQVPTGSFGKLEKLEILGCDKFLFSPSMARGLVHLRKLSIERCLMLEEVVVKEEEAEEESRMNEIIFSRLETLKLENLRRLTSLIPVKHALELPSLQKVKLFRCPEMKTFSLGPLSTPKLENVNYSAVLWMDDLNNTIRHIYETMLKLREVENTSEEDAQLESTSEEDAQLESTSEEDAQLESTNEEDEATHDI